MKINVIKAFEEVKKKAKTATLLITGHGIGGALANFAALEFYELGIVVDEVYTFGAPKIGNYEFTKYLGSKLPDYFSVIN